MAGCRFEAGKLPVVSMELAGRLRENSVATVGVPESRDPLGGMGRLRVPPTLLLPSSRNDGNLTGHLRWRWL